MVVLLASRGSALVAPGERHAAADVRAAAGERR